MKTSEFIPHDIWREIVEFLPLKDRINMRKSSKEMKGYVDEVSSRKRLRLTSKVITPENDPIVWKSSPEMMCLLQCGESIHHFAVAGKTDALSMELYKGVCPNICDNSRMTPVMFAAIAGNIDTLTYLVKDASADIHARDITNTSAIIWAVKYSKVDTFQKCVELGANTNDRDSKLMTPIIWAVAEGHCNIIKVGVEIGCNINEIDAQGRTLAMISILYKTDITVLKLCIDLGCNINTPDRCRGHTALMHAIREGMHEHLILLLEHGADVNAHDNYGRTALMYAARLSDEISIRACVKYGGNVNAVDHGDMTALIYLVNNGTMYTKAYNDANVSCLKSLIELGANVNHGDYKGMTAVKYIVKSQSTIDRFAESMGLKKPRSVHVFFSLVGSCWL